MMKYDRKYISDEAVEKYDDARFALLMEGYSARLGEEYAEENQRLREDDSFEFPSDLDEKCIKAIDNAIARKKRRENMEKAKKVARRLTLVAASFLVVIVLSSVVLYNTVEAFRLSVIDYVIELLDIGEGSIVSVEASDIKNHNVVVPTWMPTGYEVELDRSEAGIKVIRYSNGLNNIFFSAHSEASVGGMTIDTEDAIETYNIRIVDYNGVVVKKAQDVSLYWFDVNTSYYIWMDSKELDVIIRMAESCYE